MSHFSHTVLKPTKSVLIRALEKAAYLMNAILLFIHYKSWFLPCSSFCKKIPLLLSPSDVIMWWPGIPISAPSYSQCLIYTALRCLCQMKLYRLKLEAEVASAIKKRNRCIHREDSMLFCLIPEAYLMKWSRPEKI